MAGAGSRTGQGLSLRARLNLLIAAAMALMVGIGAAIAIGNARDSVNLEAHATATLALQLIEAGAAEARNAGRPVAEWLLQLGRLEHTRHLRIRVTGATAGPLDLSGPPRFASGTAPDWFRWTVAPQPLVLEQRLPGGPGDRLTVRLEADTEDELAEAWQETRGFLMLVLALAGLVYGLVHVTVGRAFRSVATILEGLEGIERGDYGQRLPAFPLPEFTRIAGAFNHMAAALEASRAENHALIQHALRLQEEERRHLARDLHDELGQALTAIKVMAAALRRESPLNQEAADHILNLCDRSFEVFRTMMRRLRPSVLDELGLSASLEELAQDWRLSHPELTVELACEPDVDEGLEAARIHLFRIVQEGLTNVVKHAEARRVAIRLYREQTGDGPVFVLRLEDDGRGFDPHAPHRRPGLGLAGMRERVASLSGQVALETRPGRGVALEFRIPVGVAGA